MRYLVVLPFHAYLMRNSDIKLSFVIAIVVKHLYGASFVSKLFLSVVSHISLSCSFISHPLFGIICCWFSIPLFLKFGVQREAQLNIYSVGCTHYSVHSMHYSVGCRHYSIGCTLYSVGCICRLYALLCRLRTMHYWWVSCKHILCRLSTMLGQS